MMIAPMTKNAIRDRGSSPPFLLKGKLLAALPVALWITLAVAAVWRLLLAWQVMAAPGESTGALAIGQAAVVVHWRQLDALFGWAVFLLWLMTVTGLVGGSRQRARIAMVVAVFSLVGVLLSAMAIAWDVWNPGQGSALAFIGERLDKIAAIWLALIGLAAVLWELRAVSGDISDGQIHLVHLWRVLTAQWVLAWLAANLFLQLFQRKGDLLGNEGVRQLLFNIPALGLLPNLLMLSGIRLWNLVMRPGPDAPAVSEPLVPRCRAWILAMILAPLGGILVVLRSPWMGIFGGGLLLVAIVLYAVGFPRGAWKKIGSDRPAPGGLWHLWVWMFFVFAIGVMVLERGASLSSGSSGLAFLGSGWRHLLFVGFGLWLLHACLAGQALLLAPRFRLGGERLIFLLAVLLLAGGGWIGIDLMLTSQQLGEAQVPMLRKLFWGAVPEALAIVAIGGVLLRTAKANRRSAP
jgi:hypothetical protein